MRVQQADGRRNNTRHQSPCSQEAGINEAAGDKDGGERGGEGVRWKVN